MYGALHSPSALAERGLLALAHEFTPRVESLGPTDVLLDLHGLGRVWAAPEVLGHALLLAGRDRGFASTPPSRAHAWPLWSRPAGARG